MSTVTASRLPRIPTKSSNSVNGSSKSQKGLVKKPSSTGINKSPNMLSSTTQPTQIAPSAATNVDQTKKMRSSLKTNIDTTNKTSPVSGLLPSTKSSISSSVTNDIKSPAKKSLAAQTVKQTSLLKRKSDNTRTQLGAAPSSNNRKSTIQTPKSISNNTSRKKETSVQQQSRISTKNSTNLTTSTRNNEPRTGTAKLLAEIEKLRAENNKLKVENKGLMQEKGLLTADVCQMEHRLACEESRVIELEVDAADLRSLLNGKHNQLGDHVHYRSELDIANNLIMEQAIIMSDQQSLIEELMTQLDEQERVCQDLQNVIDSFKTKHDVLGDKIAWRPLDLTICTF
jgi:hypothetical protein